MQAPWRCSHSQSINTKRRPAADEHKKHQVCAIVVTPLVYRTLFNLSDGELTLTCHVDLLSSLSSCLLLFIHRNQPLCSCTLSDSHLFTQRSLQHQSILAITSICHHTIIGLKIDGTPGTGANAHEAARRQRRARAPFRANHMWHAVAQFFRARHAARVDDGHKAWPEG